MDMHTRIRVARKFGGRSQRVVTAGERGVHAHHGPPASGQESAVLLKPTPGAIGAVSIGDAVRAHNAHTDFSTGISDHVE